MPTLMEEARVNCRRESVIPALEGVREPPGSRNLVIGMMTVVTQQQLRESGSQGTMKERVERYWLLGLSKQYKQHVYTMRQVGRAVGRVTGIYAHDNMYMDRMKSMHAMTRVEKSATERILKEGKIAMSFGKTFPDSIVLYRDAIKYFGKFSGGKGTIEEFQRALFDISGIDPRDVK